MTTITVPVEFILNVLDAPKDFDFDDLYLLFDYSFVEAQIQKEFEINAHIQGHETRQIIGLIGDKEEDIPSYLVNVEFVVDVLDDFDYDDLYLNFDYDHIALVIKDLFDIGCMIEGHETQLPYETNDILDV